MLLLSAAHEQRGAGYAQALARLFDALPYVARSDDFIACHAGAPRGAVTRRRLVEIHDNPGLAEELLWVRPRRPGRPAGFGKRDVARLRNALGAPGDTPVIVGHTPLDDEGVLWLDAADIADFHVIYDSREAGVPVFTRLRGGIAPLEYRPEPLITT